MTLGRTAEEQFPLAAHSEQRVSPFISTHWGWLPVLSVVNALALVLTAFAMTAARSNAAWAEPLFWLSLLIIFAPTALRLASPTMTRQERWGLVLLAGMALYLVKVLRSPTGFTFHDEFLHWRTAADILRTGRLFSDNPILPVSSLYPGLEILTTAVANLTGLAIYPAGVITIGVGRVLLMLSLYLFFEQVSRSERIGGIATLIYLGNANFLFFDGQFSYESLALPIATAILCAVIRREAERERNFWRLLILTLPLIGALAVTHHLTGYVLVGLLFLFTLAAVIYRRSRLSWASLGVITLIAFAAVSGWASRTAGATDEYLTPVLTSGATEFVQFIFNENVGRQLFRGAAGQSSPVWERVIGVVSTICILVILPIGILRIWQAALVRLIGGLQGISSLRFGALQSWRRYRNNPFALAFSGVIFLHPLMLALRFTSSGWEIANRSSEFVFWAVTLVIAIGIVSVQAWHIPRRLWMGGFVIWASLIFVGGIISGWPPWGRLPGDYLVSGDSRSIEPQGIAAANWTNTFLNGQDRIAADRINTLLLATYGHQQPVTHLHDNVYLASLFFAPQIGAEERQLIKTVNLRYLLADERLSTGLPQVGFYFEAGEPPTGEPDNSVPPEVLTKFSDLSNVSQLFDSGSIKIYDLSGLRAAS